MANVYEGDSPYIFISYAHADSKIVLPIIDALDAAGYRVWYDEGIEWAVEWPKNIADHLYSCSRFLVFMSQQAAVSENCGDEIHYALDHRKDMLVAYISDVNLDEINRGLSMRLSKRQAKRRSDYDSDEAFINGLIRTKVLQPCLREDAPIAGTVRTVAANDYVPISQDVATRRGGGVWIAALAIVALALAALVLVINNRTDGNDSKLDVDAVALASAGADDADGDAVAAGDASTEPGDVSSTPAGITVKSFDEYDWSELRTIADEIGAADGDAEGLEIAKSYGLVDADGKLQGDTKSLPLADGTSAAVRIVGFRHDDRVDGNGKAGITFEFSDTSANHQMNTVATNAGGWMDSEMRSWLNVDYLSLFPEELRGSIVAVSKRTNNVGEIEFEGDVASVTSTVDKLWLLSLSEVYGKLLEQEENAPDWSTATYNAEGTQYKYYTDQGVSTRTVGPCKKGGVSAKWWLRSPSAYNSSDFLYVNDDGDWYRYESVQDWGVSLGFCL